MISIDEVCSDGEAKHWAAVLSDSAATILIAGTPKERAIETEGQPLVVYNVYKSIDYNRMLADSFLPLEIKLGFKNSDLTSKFPLTAKFTSESLMGWHVLRTLVPLAGRELKEVLTSIQIILGSEFYIKSRERIGVVRDCLIMEEVYRV